MDNEMVAGANSGVAESPVQTEVSNTTPVVDGGVAGATPPVPQSDAELVKLREDISRIKSAADKRQFEMTRSFQAQMEAMQQQILERERALFEARTQGLEPAEKKQAEAQWQAQQRESQLQQQVEIMQRQIGELTQAQQAEQRKNQAVMLFSHLNDIPPEELAKHADSPDELTEYIRKVNLERKTKAERQPDPAPNVTKQRPSGTSTGLTQQLKEMSSADRRKLMNEIMTGRRVVNNSEL